jgi:hypothetical protein
MNPLSPIEIAAVQQCQRSVRRMVEECPECLHGPVLVHSLMHLLNATAPQDDPVKASMAHLGIAAAAIAALVENERATERGERSVVA